MLHSNWGEIVSEAKKSFFMTLDFKFDRKILFWSQSFIIFASVRVQREKEEKKLNWGKNVGGQKELGGSSSR